MPYLRFQVAPEVFLEHRGIRVFHLYRSQEFPERYQFQFSLSANEEDYSWHFDVREWISGAEPDDRAALIRATLDRCLDDGQLFPYLRAPGPLPDASENEPLTSIPDDWDILDMLLAVRMRTLPVTEAMNGRHRAGVVQLLKLLTKLDPARQALVEQWLSE